MPESKSQQKNNFENFLIYSSKLGSNILRGAGKFVKKYELNFLLDKLAQKPVLAITLIIFFCVTIVPITVFVIFVTTTILVTVTGLVLIEGTLVTVGSILLCGCLISAWIVLGVLMITAASFYYGTLYLHNHMQNKDLATLCGLYPKHPTETGQIVPANADATKVMSTPKQIGVVYEE